MNHEAIKQAVAAAAAELGVQDYEINITTEESAGAEAMKGEISSVSYTRSSAMQVRCVKDGRSGYAVSDLVVPEVAAELVAQACDNASVIDEADIVGLYEGGEAYQSVEDHAQELPSSQEMMRQALELQHMVCAASDKILDTSGCAVQGTSVSRSMLSSTGLDLAYSNTLVYRAASAAVKDGDDASDGGRFCALSKETPEESVKKAVDEAFSKLGAEAVDTGKYDIILDANCVRALISTYSGVFSARNAYLKTTRMAGMEGRQVASPIFSLVDDPFHPEKVGHCPFDGEGVPVRTKAVVENGVLKTLLYNRMYAKLLGQETTGNAADVKHIEPKGLYVVPGDLSKDQLLEKLGNGLYITDLGGLHSGANTQSGDFSLPAGGFLVENGKKTRPVKNITIADNFFDFIKKVDALSDQVDFGTGSDFGAPEILFTGISVSGK